MANIYTLTEELVNELSGKIQANTATSEEVAIYTKGIELLSTNSNYQSLLAGLSNDIINSLDVDISNAVTTLQSANETIIQTNLDFNETRRNVSYDGFVKDGNQYNKINKNVSYYSPQITYVDKNLNRMYFGSIAGSINTDCEIKIGYYDSSTSTQTVLLSGLTSTIFGSSNYANIERSFLMILPLSKSPVDTSIVHSVVLKYDTNLIIMNLQTGIFLKIDLISNTRKIFYDNINKVLYVNSSSDTKKIYADTVSNITTVTDMSEFIVFTNNTPTYDFMNFMTYGVADYININNSKNYSNLLSGIISYTNSNCVNGSSKVFYNSYLVLNGTDVNYETIYYDFGFRENYQSTSNCFRALDYVYCVVFNRNYEIIDKCTLRNTTVSQTTSFPNISLFDPILYHNGHLIVDKISRYEISSTNADRYQVIYKIK